jgi:hypothetical protein
VPSAPACSPPGAAAAATCDPDVQRGDATMKYLLLWMLGIPIPILLLIALLR